MEPSHRLHAVRAHAVTIVSIVSTSLLGMIVFAVAVAAMLMTLWQIQWNSDGPPTGTCFSPGGAGLQRRRDRRHP